jgi:hypothetical protein
MNQSKVSNGRSHAHNLADKPAKPSNLWSKVKVFGSQIAVPLLLYVRRNSAEIGIAARVASMI